MKELDKELLKEANELLLTDYNQDDNIEGLVYDLVEKIKDLEEENERLRNPDESFDNPDYEFNYDY